MENSRDKKVRCRTSVREALTFAGSAASAAVFIFSPQALRGVSHQGYVVLFFRIGKDEQSVKSHTGVLNIGRTGGQ